MKYRPASAGIEITREQAERLIPELRRLDMNELAERTEAQFNPKVVTVCSMCGSPDVQYESWIDANDVPQGDCGGDPYCPHCEEHDTPTESISPEDVLPPGVEAKVHLSDEACEALDLVPGQFSYDRLTLSADGVVQGPIWNLGILAEDFEKAADKTVKRPLPEALRQAAEKAADDIRCVVRKTVNDHEGTSP